MYALPAQPSFRRDVPTDWRSPSGTLGPADTIVPDPALAPIGPADTLGPDGTIVPDPALAPIDHGDTLRPGGTIRPGGTRCRDNTSATAANNKYYPHVPVNSNTY